MGKKREEKKKKGHKKRNKDTDVHPAYFITNHKVYIHRETCRTHNKVKKAAGVYTPQEL